MTLCSSKGEEGGQSEVDRRGGEHAQIHRSETDEAGDWGARTAPRLEAEKIKPSLERMSAIRFARNFKRYEQDPGPDHALGDLIMAT